jgi:hypothetical protein
MPRLLRGIARTAAIAGTATAVSGRVQRRQAERFAGRDANIYAQQEAAYEQAAPPPLPPPPAASTENDTLAQLQQLGALKEQGVLTQAEFDQQKAKILGA